MTIISTTQNRRSFLKVSGILGGGLMLNFSLMTGCQSPNDSSVVGLPEEWHDLNAYLKIASNGEITIFSPNPEGGQNVKTSMPMIVAEELDVKWENVRVEQAPLNTDLYQRQFIGGSNAIRFGWEGLRSAGATARKMLIIAAASTWQVPEGEITTEDGVLYHKPSGRSVGYGELAEAAAQLPVPEDVPLKEVKDFKIISTSKKNVDGLKIVTGKPLFGMDTYREGMLTAMIIHPPAFGMKFSSMDATPIKAMPGIKDVFVLKVLKDDFERQHFDTCTFLEVVAIVGDTTWQVMNAKKALKVDWEPFEEYQEERTFWGGAKQSLTIPAGLENTADLDAKMNNAAVNAEVVRKDGNPDQAFESATRVIERKYTAPYLAHNCMEPMNFFADVKNGKATLIGPLQKAELTEQTVEAHLGIPRENIDIQMTRLGGGYGRRSYAHWVTEAALISQRMMAPVKLVYSREDDMTGGIYRPAYQATYKAAINDQNELTALSVNAGGMLDSPLYADRFPAGAIDHYMAEKWQVNSNITIGSFRAPRSNFMASAEQTFLDELAEELGKDPIDFRLELLKKAKQNPVGEKMDYDPDRMASVLKLVREKSNWGSVVPGISRGVAVYFCHNSYSAQVLDLKMEGNRPVVEKVYCAVDCGIVVNPDAAKNLAEGAIVDGIGNAMFGELTFNKGVPEQRNFDRYQMIRMRDAPKDIEIHFVENEIAPTGLGEPTFPPVFAALANALYKSTGQRLYDQPFNKQKTLG